MATISVDGVDNPRGSGEQEFPRFNTFAESMFTLRFNNNPVGLSGGQVRMFPVWDTDGKFSGVTFQSVGSPGPVPPPPPPAV